MRHLFLALILLVGIVVFPFLNPKSSFIHPSPVYADELDDLSKQISDLTKSLEQSRAATRPLEAQLSTLQKKLSDILARVAAIEAELKQKRKQIDEGYVNLAAQEEKFNEAVRDFYIQSYYDYPYLLLLSQDSTSETTRLLAYHKRAAEEDKRIITNLAISVADLETKRTRLEGEEKRLAVIKEELSTQTAFLDKEVKGAKAYQATLSSKIIQLSARQNEILGQRLAGLNLPRSAGTAAPACVDDRDKDPGFSPRLAFFTYGVPNRTGLNQYGANGRANSGQGVEQILNSYYANYELKKDYSTGITINVQGHGNYNIEDYVKRIYEMPGSFHMEALKAQAIAARSYALAYTNNGAGSICTTEQCQVFKPEEKGGAWNQAVEATRGWVMVQGGQPVKAWYSSTHGGYTLATSELPGWSSTSWTKHATDTTTGSAGSFADLHAHAYDKESPWFYCDWGSRSQYNKTAWLKPDEVADVVNTLLLVQADSSATEHLYQTDKPNPAGTDNWNEGRVKDELKNRGITPYNSVTSVSVGADFGTGATNSVNVSGDAGSKSFSGGDFKNRFNLRAPANIQIVGPLYNTERR